MTAWYVVQSSLLAHFVVTTDSVAMFVSKGMVAIAQEFYDCEQSSAEHEICKEADASGQD